MVDQFAAMRGAIMHFLVLLMAPHPIAALMIVSAALYFLMLLGVGG